MKHQRHMFKLLIYVLLGVMTVSAYPVDLHHHKGGVRHKVDEIPSTRIDRQEDPWRSIENGDIISVRITSSVAVEHGKKERDNSEHLHDKADLFPSNVHQATDRTTSYTNEDVYAASASERHSATALPPSLAGANVEFIKQLRSKKEGRSHVANEHLHPFHLTLGKQNATHADSVAQASDRHTIDGSADTDGEDGVPRARSIPQTPYFNSFQTTRPKINVTRDRKRNSTTTRVSFDVVHDVPSHPRVYSEPAKVYSEPSKMYGEPSKVYGEPELFYSEPAKIYSEPSKVYSEPAKVYGEPSKVYSEPAKVYGEPAKFYSEPASLHLDDNEPKKWETTSERSPEATTHLEQKDSPKAEAAAEAVEQRERGPEQGYEAEEGGPHGAPESSTESKVGYVLEGNEYRKYRVEERTPDGFIVGEYGVVSHNDGSLRGVRYTADGDASPRLIHDALMKFLHLTK